eukprot:CAMPEP_0201596942 /NCGR_PEP_ID=MMETSP0190_2-20130828/193537_1 /ASSEMBLY_ACC=CAM_ASM_000263 /TAXON_ID=37353 /ORGANISM="Rosalina sp." /LENGTH=307 /DNA_ID=CAMNT_0048057617 /DNA_START=485 /DNA_END=1408 /DNA_ORIENTATION=-
MAEEKEGSENGSVPVMIESSHRSTRKQKGSRRSARLAKKQRAKEQISEPPKPPKPAYPNDETINDEVKSEEIIEEIEEEQDQNEIISNNKSNVEDFRRYVQDYLETPDRVQMPRSRIRPNIIEPSPRIDAITINNKSSKIEFLVPPRKQEEAMEIREQVRNLLSPNTEPMTTQKLDPLQGKAPSRSPSLPYDEMSKYGDKLRQDKTTRLWSPYAPNFDKEKADRTAKLLITLMFVIGIAVFIKLYQEDIIVFLKPIIQDLKQFVIRLLYKEQISESIIEDNNMQDDNNDIDNDIDQQQQEQDFTVTK